MAFEGAKEHFCEAPPEIPPAVYSKLESIGPPQKFKRAAGDYGELYVPASDDTEYQKCYGALRTIRNNFIHANKARKPDTQKRLDELLDWALCFVSAVCKSESEFSRRVEKIKEVIGIENF